MRRIVLILIAVVAFLAGSRLISAKTINLPSDSTTSITLAPSPISTALAPRTTEEQNTIEVYRETNESVVFISTMSMTADPFDWYPQHRAQEGSGSGVIIDAEQGIVLTNLHVISNAQKIAIILSDTKAYNAKLLGIDRATDLAVLAIINPPEHIKAVKLGNSDILEVGQRVLAIGNPFGLNRTLTTGIISSLDRTLKTSANNYLKGLIQTDAAINPGNSGGPLLNSSSELIGINSVILSQSGDSAGIGFAIPINKIKKILPELIKTGKVARPDFGWVLADTNQGPVVRRVFKDTPAAAAEIQGLERYVSNGFLQSYYHDYNNADLIFSVNGQKVANKLAVENIIENIQPGESLKFEFRRGGLFGKVFKKKIKPEWR